MARTVKLWTTLVSLLLLLALGAAGAQGLTTVLPEGTVFALGVEDLSSHVEKFDELLAEAERLELGQALGELFGGGSDALALEEELPEFMATLDDVPPLDLFGQEAWLAVSISEFNPLPALSFVSRIAPSARDHVRAAIEAGAGTEGTEMLEEGGETIYLITIDGGDSPYQMLALSLAGDVVVATTNPDVARGILRRLAGSGEPSFADSEGYEATQALLGGGNAYSFLDYSSVADALAPFGAATGFEGLVGRALAGLGTFGVSASVTSIDEDGWSSTTVRTPGSGDPALAALLVGDESASREPLDFVGPTALGVSASHLELSGWWDYLSDLARSSDELGNPDLNQMAMQFTGIDLQTTLFSWMGSQAGTITGPLGAPVEPGLPSENLLGAYVYFVEATDEAAASQGLTMLFSMASSLVAGFTDATGQGRAAIEERESSGVPVTSYAMGPGFTIAHAVVDGWALIATSDAALDDALAAYSEGAGLPPVLDRLADRIPAEATSYYLTDLNQALAQSGAQTASQLQMFAGMTGGEIDFDALERAGEAIESFFAFLADRAGGSVSYTVPDENGVVRSTGIAEFRW